LLVIDELLPELLLSVEGAVVLYAGVEFLL
jgi:hypothetical protein